MADPPRARRKSRPTGLVSSRHSDRTLTRDMSCEAALRAIARDCVAGLRRHDRNAARGDAEALHQMRIGLTRLRTAIRFFSPGVDESAWRSLLHHAAWLSRQSSAVRDIDVALERQNRKAADVRAKRWLKERDARHKRLRRALRSKRYGRFIVALSRRSHPAAHDSFPVDRSRSSVGDFSTRRLGRWQRNLLTKGRKLEHLGRRKRHRLRLRAKRFRYALEWSLPLFVNERTVLREQIRQAKLIQKALGTLNDGCMHQAQASALKIEPLTVMVRLVRQRSQRRLLKSARRAFVKLERLKPPGQATSPRHAN